MSDDPQPIARVSDQVQHSRAPLFRRIGAVVGALAGVAVLAGAVALAGGLTVVTAGLATPVLIGAVLVAGSGIAMASSAFSNWGGSIGKLKFFAVDEGPITTGEETVFAGQDRRRVAHVDSNVSCRRHRHFGSPVFEPPAPDVINPALEQIVQGSATVRVGVFGLPVSREGSRGTCGFTVGKGLKNVIVGGPTVTMGTIGDGDDPYDGFRSFMDSMGHYAGWVAIAGAALLAAPSIPAMLAAGAGAWLIGKAVGKGLELLPEGVVRDGVAAFLTLVPLAGLPRTLGGIRARSENEGLRANQGESAEAFAARVRDARNARLEAEWRSRVEASKRAPGQIPTDAWGRPIPAYETVPAAGGRSTGGGRGPTETRPQLPPTYQMSGNNTNQGGGSKGANREGSETTRSEGEASSPSSGVTVKEGKWDYFNGRLQKPNPLNEDGTPKPPKQLEREQHNYDRAQQNLKDLQTLGLDEATVGREPLQRVFEEGLKAPEAETHTTEYGVTVTRTVQVPPKGSVDVKYFYPNGDMSATPEVSTIIPKIHKGGN